MPILPLQIWVTAAPASAPQEPPGTGTQQSAHFEVTRPVTQSAVQFRLLSSPVILRTKGWHVVNRKVNYSGSCGIPTTPATTPAAVVWTPCRPAATTGDSFRAVPGTGTGTEPQPDPAGLPGVPRRDATVIGVT